MGILRPVQKVGVLGNIAPGAGRKRLGLYLGFKGGVRVELGGVRVVVAFFKASSYAVDPEGDTNELPLPPNLVYPNDSFSQLKN